MEVFLNLTIFHIKRILKEPKILMMIAAPLFMVFFMMMIFNSNEGPSTGKFGIENHSIYFEDKIYPKLEENLKVDLSISSENLQEDLMNRKLDMVYIIPENFEKEPRIIAKSLDGQRINQYFENQMMQIMMKVSKNDVLKKHKLQLKNVSEVNVELSHETKLLNQVMMLSIFMIVYFMYLNSAMFSMDIFNMRKSQVLRRSIVSKCPKAAILGSVLTAYGLILFIMSIITLILIAWLSNAELQNMMLLFLFIMANIIFIMGEIIFLFRVIKDQNVLQSLSMVIGMGVVLLPTFTLDTKFEKLGMISPFYWTMEGLDYQTFWPYGIIIIIMGILLFTAGTLRLEELSNQHN